MTQPNWKQMVLDLEKEFGSLSSAALAMGEYRAKLHHLKTGRTQEPKWAFGNELIRLHGEHCGGMKQ